MAKPAVGVCWILPHSLMLPAVVIAAAFGFFKYLAPAPAGEERALPIATIEPQPRPVAQFPDRSVSPPARPTLALVGVTLRGSTHSMAIIAIDNGPQKVYTKEQEIYAGAVLKEIHADRAVVGYDANRETLYLKSASAAAIPVESIAEPRHTPVAEPESMLRDVKLVRTASGEYVVQSISNASIYDRLGLQPGDIVYDVDKLLDLQYPAEALENFKDREVRFQIFRDGHPIFISYRIDL